MRRSIPAAVAGLLMLGAPLAHAELVDRVAAIVNTDVITLSEVEKRAAPELARVDQETTGPERAQKRAQAMRTPRKSCAVVSAARVASSWSWPRCAARCRTRGSGSHCLIRSSPTR